MANTDLGQLIVIHRKSYSLFKLFIHQTKSEIDVDFGEEETGGWSPEREVEMAVGSGFKRVHDSDAERWGFWDAAKEVN